MSKLVLSLLLVLPLAVEAQPYAKQAKCLADNLHYEARGESLAGIRAVANVVLNRVKSKRWPNTVCEVVYQYKQFSWANKARARHPTNVAYTQQVQLVVSRAIAGKLKDNTRGATHYHTLAVKPRWRKKLIRIRTIGFHVFYRYGK
jgi:spore germination cell wall hydrolase CwlJ-like protein|tara:strand:+ start:139 stop:576 length:438 start_codon:yes stop_codon:yes gene_type:complete